MKQRTIARAFVLLKTSDQGQRGIELKAIAGCQPLRCISEGDGFLDALLIVSQFTDQPRFVAETKVDDPFHGVDFSGLMRMRLGTRSASKSRP